MYILVITTKSESRICIGELNTLKQTAQFAVDNDVCQRAEIFDMNAELIKTYYPLPY